MFEKSNALNYQMMIMFKIYQSTKNVIQKYIFFELE
jgi:hypothetical protein